MPTPAWRCSLDFWRPPSGDMADKREERPELIAIGSAQGVEVERAPLVPDLEVAARRPVDCWHAEIAICIRVGFFPLAPLHLPV